MLKRSAMLSGASFLALAVAGFAATGVKAEPVLDNIIVTATKQERNLQEIPISVSAVSEESFQRFSVSGDDIRLLTARVPNLNAESTFGRAYPRFYLRGLGNDDFALNAQSSAELYFDEVVLGNPILKGLPVFDVERIEVLRGPQGTIFGRNAVAGAVHIVTKKPTDEFDGRASLAYGNFNTINAEAAVGGPIVDGKLSGRVAVLYQSRNDYVNNLVTGNEVGGYTDVATRAQLNWTPTSAFSGLLQFYSRTFDGPAALFHSTADDPTFGRQAFDRENILLDNDNVPNQEIDSVGVNLRMEYDFGFGAITSISSINILESHSVGDVDATASPSLINVDDIDNLMQYTQEVRFASDQSQAFRYQLGGYYFRENLDYANSTANNSFQIPTPPGPFDLGQPGDPGFGAVQFVNQDLTSWSIWANLEYDITERLTILGGVRYNNDDTEASRIVGQFTPNPDNLQSIPSFNTPFYQAGGRGLISLFGADVDQENSFDTDEITWDVSLNFNLLDNVNLYGRVARGYQGARLEAGGPFAAFTFARPQTVLSYEIGVKSEPIPNKMRANLTLFRYDFDDQQLNGFVDTGMGGFTAQLFNANGGTGQGVELELEYQVTDRLFVGGNFGYTDTEIEGPTFFSDLAGNPVDLDGRRFTFAPEITGAFFAEYRHPTDFVGGGDFYVNTDWAYRGEIDARFTAIEDPQFLLDGYWEGAASAGLRTDRFDIGLWARNIANETGGTSVLSVIGFESQVFTQPRTFGVRASLVL